MGSAVDALVAGAGGFIGGHLVGALLTDGLSVRAVDIKPSEQWHQLHEGVDNRVLDLADLRSCRAACESVVTVYNLAADMGGMGFIENNKAACMLSVLPSTHMLLAARDAGVSRFFYSSSACVYPAGMQQDSAAQALAECHAYPADPEDGYGWEKLFTERMARHFFEDFGLETRVARYHNVYGPHGTWRGGREKAPAALCRKVAEAVLTRRRAIDIWGDGEQTRSFMFISDCVRGTRMIAESDSTDPLNLGSSELVSVNDLVGIIEDIAGTSLERNYLLDAPKGVRGRNSDNALIRDRLGWEPSVSLRAGLVQTYAWVHDQVATSMVTS